MQAQWTSSAEDLFARRGIQRQLAKQLAGAVQLNLQAGKKTEDARRVDGGRCIGAALVHEMPALVLKWRSVQKLKGT